MRTSGAVTLGEIGPPMLDKAGRAKLADGEEAEAVAPVAEKINEPPASGARLGGCSIP